jgi:hypothetical protein
MVSPSLSTELNFLTIVSVASPCGRAVMIVRGVFMSETISSVFSYPFTCEVCLTIAAIFSGGSITHIEFTRFLDVQSEVTTDGTETDETERHYSFSVSHPFILISLSSHQGVNIVTYEI